MAMHGTNRSRAKRKPDPALGLAALERIESELREKLDKQKNEPNHNQ